MAVGGMLSPHTESSAVRPATADAPVGDECGRPATQRPASPVGPDVVAGCRRLLPPLLDELPALAGQGVEVLLLPGRVALLHLDDVPVAAVAPEEVEQPHQVAALRVRTDHVRRLPPLQLGGQDIAEDEHATQGKPAAKLGVDAHAQQLLQHTAPTVRGATGQGCLPAGRTPVLAHTADEQWKRRGEHAKQRPLPSLCDVTQCRLPRARGGQTHLTASRIPLNTTYWCWPTTRRQCRATIFQGPFAAHSFKLHKAAACLCSP